MFQFNTKLLDWARQVPTPNPVIAPAPTYFWSSMRDLEDLYKYKKLCYFSITFLVQKIIPFLPSSAYQYIYTYLAYTYVLSNPNENQSFPKNEIAQFEIVHNDILEKVVVTTDRFLFFDSVVVVWLVVCIPDRKI